MLAYFAEGVWDCDKLSCNGSNDDLVWFSCGTKAVGECLEDLIMMAGDESGLQHHMPKQPSPTADVTLATHGAAVMCDWRKACARNSLPERYSC